MNARLRLLISIGLPLLLIAIVVGAFLFQQQRTGLTSNPEGTQPLEKMTLALDWTPNTNHTGIYVARQQGWYKEQGIDLQILPYSANVTPDVLVNSGQADLGISSAESVVADTAAGQPVISLAAIYQQNTSALAVLESSGIESPRDLDGKVYGGFGASFEDAVVSAVIKHDGGKGDFRNVTLDTSAMEALKAGRIDFVWIFEGVEGVQAAREGVKLKVFPITKFGVPNYYTPTIVTGPTQIQQKPELLRKFMAATIRGYEYARDHVAESAQMLIDGAGKGVFPDVEYVMQSQEYASKHYTVTGGKWGVQRPEMWRDYPTFMLNAKAVTDASGKPVEHLDFESMYTNEFFPS